MTTLIGQRGGTALDLIELIQRKAPEYLDLLTSESEDAFDEAFDALLEKAVIHLESNKRNYANLDEVALSSILAAHMTIPGLTVSQEKHSNGHVDLIFEADHCTPARRKLGEAKIYGGPVYHLKGLSQLLDRYTTGREGRGLLIVYFKKQSVSQLVQKLREHMDQNLPLDQQGATAGHTLKWSFLSVHAHSCGENLQVGHVGCNLYVE